VGKEGEVEVDIVEPLRRTQARAQGRCVACRRACGKVWVASGGGGGSRGGGKNREEEKKISMVICEVHWISLKWLLDYSIDL
jgi:hypothetical protein